MNKHWRSKNFSQSSSQRLPRYKSQSEFQKSWNDWDWDDWNCHSYGPSSEDINKKEFRTCCIVVLSLLVCIIIYALCIHFNLFGIKDWYQRNEPIQETVTRKTSTKETATVIPGEEPAAYIEHFVNPGDTLWQIADRYHPNEDARKIIWAIRTFNRDKNGERMSAKILPGQVVKVPLDVEAVEETEINVQDIQPEEREQEIELASRQDNRTKEQGRDYGK